MFFYHNAPWLILKHNTVLHPNFLALLGLHIGELWDLKTLSEHCRRTGRYTFFLTSMPLNFAGACGSPPNAMALF